MKEEMKDIENLAKLMDARFGIFGFRFGLDGLIGLIPGVGDFITSTVSVYIVYRAFSMGFSFVIVLQMLLNILIEYVVGLIPIVGDLFDFFWKANLKNIEIMKNCKEGPAEAVQRSSRVLASFAFVIFACFAVLLFAVIKLVSTFVGLLS